MSTCCEGQRIRLLPKFSNAEFSTESKMYKGHYFWSISPLTRCLLWQSCQMLLKNYQQCSHITWNVTRITLEFRVISITFCSYINFSKILLDEAPLEEKSTLFLYSPYSIRLSYTHLAPKTICLCADSNGQYCNRHAWMDFTLSFSRTYLAAK